MVNYQGIVFDLDGTLVDSVASITSVVNVVLAQEGRESLSKDEVKGMLGEGASRLLQRAFAATGPSVENDNIFSNLLNRYIQLLVAMPPSQKDLYPGVVDTLHTLYSAGIRFAVCTNKPVKAAQAALKAMRIREMFQVVIGGDTLPQRKPSPEPVLAAIAGLNTVLKEVVMIGDNIYDVDAGHRAGIPVIAVSYGYPRMLVTDLNADLIIDRFDKLPWALERLSHSLT